MTYEVEEKFAIHAEDVPRLQRDLAVLGAIEAGAAIQVDTYFNHPSRDFAQTDEAVRIRRQNEKCWLTYKGPKIDAETKTRREIDLPLVDSAERSGEYGSVEPDAARQWIELLLALGFRVVADVMKTRRTYQVSFRDYTIELALDSIEQLGWFVELELPATDDAQLAAAQAAIAALAAQLGLENSERRSYLELLLDS